MLNAFSQVHTISLLFIKCNFLFVDRCDRVDNLYDYSFKGTYTQNFQNYSLICICQKRKIVCANMANTLLVRTANTTI